MASFGKKSRAKRRIRVVELWALGFSAEETAQAMCEQNYRISPRTVYRDRHSTEAREYIDELIRRQLRDIAQADLEQKLNYRDKLLSKLIPQKIEAFSIEKREETVTINVTDDEDAILSKAASILARKDRAQKIH